MSRTRWYRPRSGWRVLRRPVVVLAVGALCLSGALHAPPAASAPPTPVTPGFPSTIDAFPRYEGETGCDPVAKPGALELQRIIRETYGTGIATNIPRGCTSASSGHEEGRALDWMTNVRDPGQAALAQAFLSWLLAPDAHGNSYAMARRLGVMYVIWDSRKLYLWDTSPAWTEYSSCLTGRTSAADDNYCHRNHVHVSLGWPGAWAETSWFWLGGESRPSCPPAAALPASTASYGTDLGYVPVAPARLLDTRSGDGTGAGACWLSGGARLDLQVTGRGGVPASGVASAVLNVTATDAKLNSWIAAYPAGRAYGGTSSVNVGRGGTSAALVVVPVGNGGRVSLRAGGGGTDVLVDVVGYYPSDGSGARYVPVEPRRALDRQVSGRSWTEMSVAVPADTVGVITNVTTDQPGAQGYLSLLPAANPNGAPATSSVNASAGATVANRALSPLGTGGLALYAHSGTRAVVDVNGYFASAGAGYTALTPQRIVDTREGLGGIARLQGGRTATVQVSGRGGVPLGASAALVTLTNDAGTRWGHITAWQSGRPLPGTSDLNVVAHAPRANLAVVALDAQGRMDVQLNDGASDLVVDVLGYYR